MEGVQCVMRGDDPAKIGRRSEGLCQPSLGQGGGGWGVVLFLFINIMKKYNIRPNLTEPHPLIRVFMQQEIAPYGRIGRMAGIGDFFN